MREVIDISDKDIERFWSKVDVRGETDCWDWKYGKDDDGYGQFWLNRRNVKSHVVAYFLRYKKPLLKYALHTCDNPSCCNPRHIYDGSHEQNMEDMRLRERAATGDANGSRLFPERLPRGNKHHSKTNPGSVLRGEAHSRAILTEADVREIKRRYKPRGSRQTWFDKLNGPAALAREFGVSLGCIEAVVYGNHWSHLESLPT